MVITGAVVSVIPQMLENTLVGDRLPLWQSVGYKWCSYGSALNGSFEYSKLFLGISCTLCFTYVCTNMNILWSLCTSVKCWPSPLELLVDWWITWNIFQCFSFVLIQLLYFVSEPKSIRELE
jgi:hypothetical protein